jgi:hypothetical protein
MFRVKIKLIKRYIGLFFLKNRKLNLSIRGLCWVLIVTAVLGVILGKELGRWAYLGNSTTRFLVTRSEDAESRHVVDEVQASTVDNVSIDTARIQESLGSGQLDEGEKQELGTPLSIEDKIRKAFGDEGDIAVAVAKCESQLIGDKIGDEHLTFQHNGQIYGRSIGLFQIRTGGNDRGGIWVRSDNVKEFEKEMKDIELRFVERDERNQLDTYTANVRKVRVLQYRKKYQSTVWTDWQDVPLEVEEE